jgi:hypothetical protein
MNWQIRMKNDDESFNIHQKYISSPRRDEKSSLTRSPFAIIIIALCLLQCRGTYRGMPRE